MVATVRLDDILQNKLNTLAKTLNKKKSDVIREAIEHYAKSVEKSKKNRILKAVEKTKIADKDEYENFEGALNDGL